MKFNLKIGQARIQLDNLFGGDPILGASKHLYVSILLNECQTHEYLIKLIFLCFSKLGRVSNEILNANSELFLDEIKPILTDALSDLFTTIANKITESFTYNELFPDK